MFKPNYPTQVKVLDEPVNQIFNISVTGSQGHSQARPQWNLVAKHPIVGLKKYPFSVLPVLNRITIWERNTCNLMYRTILALSKTSFNRNLEST